MIYYPFQQEDIVANQRETVTRALFSGNDSNLTTFFTSSNQTAAQQAYYYEIYNSGSSGALAEPQFSVAFGHRYGSGSLNEGGQIDDTPSRGIYTQYKQLCLDSDETAFNIAGSVSDYIYALNFNRARVRDGIDERNIEINLAHLSGSEYIAGNDMSTHTGSNVQLSGTNGVLRLISDARIASPTYTSAGEVYNIISGSIEDGAHNTASPHYYGKLYPTLGIVVLDGALMDASASFGTVVNSNIAGDNSYKIFTSLSGSGALVDASGDPLGLQARSKEYVSSTHYFVRVRARDLNFSNNPTFITGSSGDLAIPSMLNNPKVYPTTIGLYDVNKNLVATAKLSKPIPKSYTSEMTVEVKLDF